MDIKTMTSTETLPEPQISPRTQKIFAKHKLYEAASSQWNYLAYKPNPEDKAHFISCRATDLEWNYDIDRYSRHLWSHQKDRYRNSSNIGGRTSRTPTKFNNSPMKASPVRRARSTSIGERINLSSPLKKTITFQPDMRINTDQPSNSYRTPRNQKQGILTPKSEKRVLEELYQLYKNSKNYGNNSARPIENRIKTDSYQTPEKTRFAMSPLSVNEREDTSRSPGKWDNQDNDDQNEYRIDIDKGNYKELGGFCHQGFDSRVSQDTKLSEIRSETEQGSQSQQTGRRSRNDRKKLKEEKMKVTQNPYNSVQQESENSLTSRALESISEINEEKQTISNQGEKVKERRSRKDRLKKTDFNEKEENQNTDGLSYAQRLIQGILGNKYSESNVEFEVEKFQNNSQSESVNTDGFETRNRENSNQLSGDFGINKGNRSSVTQNVSGIIGQEQEGFSNYFSSQNQPRQTETQYSNFHSQYRASPEKILLPNEKKDRDIEEGQERRQNMSDKKVLGSSLEKGGAEDYDTADQYNSTQKNAHDSLKVGHKSTSIEESPKSHKITGSMQNKNESCNAEDSENAEHVYESKIKKDFFNAYKGKGFSGYRLPISESRSFIDTEKDDGFSSTVKEDLKEDDNSSNNKAIPRFSNYGFDSSQQMIGLPLELSQNEFSPNEETNDREGQLDENDAYERIMRRFIDLENKKSEREQSFEMSHDPESSQELRNFIEIENQLFSKSNKKSQKSSSQLLKPETKARLNESQAHIVQKRLSENKNNNVARKLLDNFNEQMNKSRDRTSVSSNEKSLFEEENMVYVKKNIQPEENNMHHKMFQNEKRKPELQKDAQQEDSNKKSSPNKSQKRATLKMKKNMNLKSLELNEESFDGEEEDNGAPIESERINKLHQEPQEEEANLNPVNKRGNISKKDGKSEVKKEASDIRDKSRENKDTEFEQILRTILPLAESFRQSETVKTSNARASQSKEKQKKTGSSQENEEKQIIEVRPQRKRKEKATIFDTNITWEKLQLFRKVEQKAAIKIQDFCSKTTQQMTELDKAQHTKESQLTQSVSKDEFLALIETMKKHEGLYHKMKGLLNDKGDDLANLSVAFISAYCSLKSAGKSNI